MLGQAENLRNASGIHVVIEREGLHRTLVYKIRGTTAVGVTALMRATSKGHTAIVDALLPKDADMNAKTNGGETAVKAAKQKGHNEIVKLLKKMGLAD